MRYGNIIIAAALAIMLAGCNAGGAAPADAAASAEAEQTQQQDQATAIVGEWRYAHETQTKTSAGIVKERRAVLSVTFDDEGGVTCAPIGDAEGFQEAEGTFVFDGDTVRIMFEYGSFDARIEDGALIVPGEAFGQEGELSLYRY